MSVQSILKKIFFLTKKLPKTDVKIFPLVFKKITQSLIKGKLSTLRPVNIIFPSLNVIICKKETHYDLVTFLHAACFSPVTTVNEVLKTLLLKLCVIL